ncbi:AAA family ATPase [Antribacter sp. KLBMP9083]|uniref:AAA family ATPase n=1 Tax=Antribacter soli TaxID=2910976 RepID=A0AA41QHL4_9MICO|nr:AAA family ATPase [Antribacter soli]MCF4122811.1 AAA family ATPase [Antribacter soli]
MSTSVLAATAADASQRRDPAASRGRVVSVLSPKGGVGKTTVATNLAVGLAKAAPGSTVLVDLDVQFGDVASALNLAPQHSLADMVGDAASRDAMVLKTLLTQHETGLHVICGVDSPAAADGVTADDVSRLLATLAAEFRYVVVDTAPGLLEHTLAVLDQTTDPLLVTSMDVPGVRGLRKELETLDALGVGSPFIALNLTDRHSGMSVADVEATIGTGVDLLLPRSRALAASVNLGVPLIQSGGRDVMTKRLRVLVDHYAAPQRQNRRGRHLGGRR